MAISLDQVRKLALMARLELSDDELGTITPQLEGIVAFVDKLMELDTDGIEPMVHAVETVNRWVPDQLGDSLSREQALANAPNHDEECFLVPPVLG
ncbi:Glutamyl-tRNA(Gln) amidotransferase subunit C [Rosistilla oblonga]|uniref:Asp-tRNA(Asn)/Glu-tRNA(Gln) amidotransferase subunit GatC n=1 Tax=Rosistilla oblonga TaxID=2527990 RepID=UPI0011883719|nr:Asp-tRNA(Asn)/Glu-tRNA(Gln) amidotransferase subunit GatC [Rosistilla oblonga]QDV10492.1 Glutamyl-tRNA(Gln) amidotransferase subunit C [Rosistilla oblonga]